MTFTKLRTEPISEILINSEFSAMRLYATPCRELVGQ